MTDQLKYKSFVFHLQNTLILLGLSSLVTPALFDEFKASAIYICRD